MPGGSSEDEVSPPSPEDAEAIEKAADEAVADLTSQMQAAFAQIQATVDAYQANIEVQTFESPALRIVQSGPVEDPLSDVSKSDSQSEKQLKELNDKLDALLKKNAASQPSLMSSVQKWLGIGGLVALSGTALVFELISRFAHKQSGAGVPALSDAEKEQFQAAVTSWGAVPDSDYWAQVVAFAKTNGATSADLVYFMQYTQQIFPLATPYLWPQLQDQVNLANQLASNAQQAGDPISVVEQLEPGLKDSTGAVLPRAIAASCAGLALAWFADASTSRAVGPNETP
jgi:hypothetical protein